MLFVGKSAGPKWHLYGKIQRDRADQRLLTLTRRRDALSSRIGAMVGHVIPELQITGNSWLTAHGNDRNSPLCGNRSHSAGAFVRVAKWRRASVAVAELIRT